MSTALEKALLQAAELAEKYGFNLDIEALSSQEEVEEQAKETYSNALEVIINQMHHKHASEVKTCKQCKSNFITTYCYHQFCSDECRTADFIERFGINPSKLKTPQSFWEYEPVGVVPPVMTKNLYEWAKHLVDQFESLTDQEFEELPETSPTDQEHEILLEGLEGLTIEPIQFSDEKSLQTLRAFEEEQDSNLQASPQNKPGILDSISFDF